MKSFCFRNSSALIKSILQQQGSQLDFSFSVRSDFCFSTFRSQDFQAISEKAALKQKQTKLECQFDGNQEYCLKEGQPASFINNYTYESDGDNSNKRSNCSSSEETNEGTLQLRPFCFRNSSKKIREILGLSDKLQTVQKRIPKLRSFNFRNNGSIVRSILNIPSKQTQLSIISY